MVGGLIVILLLIVGNIIQGARQRQALEEKKRAFFDRSRVIDIDPEFPLRALETNLRICRISQTHPQLVIDGKLNFIDRENCDCLKGDDSMICSGDLNRFDKPAFEGSEGLSRIIDFHVTADFGGSVAGIRIGDTEETAINTLTRKFGNTQNFKRAAGTSLLDANGGFKWGAMYVTGPQYLLTWRINQDGRISRIQVRDYSVIYVPVTK
jgi:hypothetical protein